VQAVAKSTRESRIKLRLGVIFIILSEPIIYWVRDG
jgi:hypothetical protein